MKGGSNCKVKYRNIERYSVIIKDRYIGKVGADLETLYKTILIQYYE